MSAAICDQTKQQFVKSIGFYRFLVEMPQLLLIFFSKLDLSGRPTGVISAHALSRQKNEVKREREDANGGELFFESRTLLLRKNVFFRACVFIYLYMQTLLFLVLPYTPKKNKR